MTPSPTYNYPWELIVNSFSGNLSNEEEFMLQQWIDSDPLNAKKYQQLQQIWKNGLDDYKFYLMADENKAWNSFKAKLKLPEREKIIKRYDQEKKIRSISYIVSIAAVLLVLIGVGIWYTVSRKDSPIYETASNEHKKINLADGSSILLQPHTKIQVTKDYNETVRTVILISGEAFFGIKHQKRKPFIVEMDVAKVEDIGTSFTIKKLNEKIKVTVKSGKVTFIKNATKETHELTAGMSLTFNIKNETFNGSDNSESMKLLEFDDTPLSDVIVLLEKVYGKKIQITDRDVNEKKLTANLNGLPYITAIKVICKTLNLEYSVKDSVYTLKVK